MAMQDTSAQSSNGDGATSYSDGEDLSEIKNTLERSARGISTELKRGGKRLLDDATESASAFATDKKSVAAEYLQALGEAAQASCQVLEQRGYAGSSKFLTRATEGLGEFTDNLATREPGELLDEAVTYARRNPALFLGAALFAGFGLARLVHAAQVADLEGEEEEEEEMDDDFEESDEMYTDEAEQDLNDAT
jgi:ABC-type transporter Mla subunit MlaD